MRSWYRKGIVLILLVGLLPACSPQPAATLIPSLQPTEAATNTLAPIDTAAPIPTDTALPTNTIAPTEPTQSTELTTTTQAATQPVVEGVTVSFANDILPIIQSRCVNCHGGDRTEEGLVLRSHADVIAGSDNGPVVILGDAENSLLVELVTTQEMPKRGPKLTPPQIQLITEWVNQGALNN